MTRPRLHRGAPALALLLGASACDLPKATYTFTTTVQPDGRWQRTVQADGYKLRPVVPPVPYQQRKEEVTCRQVCQESGEGAARVRTCDPPDLNFADRADLEARCPRIRRQLEHAAEGRLPELAPGGWTLSAPLHDDERQGGNALSVGRFDFGALTLYSYEETFRGPFTAAELLTDGRRAADQALAFVRERLHRELGADYDLSGLDPFLVGLRIELAELLGMAAYTNLDLELLERELYRRAAARGLALKSGMKDAEIQAVLAPWFDAEVAPLFVPLRAGAPAPRFADLFSESVLGYLDETYGEELDRFGQQLSDEHRGWLGFLGDLVLDKYAFQASCRLPGQPVESNGALDPTGTARWSFGLDRFPLQPERLTLLTVVTDEARLRAFGRRQLDGPRLVALANAAREISEPSLAAVRDAVRRGDPAAINRAACAATPKLVDALGAVLGISATCAAGE